MKKKFAKIIELDGKDVLFLAGKMTDDQNLHTFDMISVSDSHFNRVSMEVGHLSQGLAMVELANESLAINFSDAKEENGHEGIVNILDKAGLNNEAIEKRAIEIFMEMRKEKRSMLEKVLFDDIPEGDKKQLREAISSLAKKIADKMVNQDDQPLKHTFEKDCPACAAKESMHKMETNKPKTQA